MKNRIPAKHFVVCKKNTGYEVSLELRKIYRVLGDPKAEKHNLVRVIDESGDSYLYPGIFFVPIKLPQTVLKALHLAA